MFSVILISSKGNYFLVEILFSSVDTSLKYYRKKKKIQLNFPDDIIHFAVVRCNHKIPPNLKKFIPTIINATRKWFDMNMQQVLQQLC